jgi:hypothetical protein
MLEQDPSMLEFNEILRKKVIDISRTDFLYVPSNTVGKDLQEELTKEYCREFVKLEKDVSFYYNSCVVVFAHLLITQQGIRKSVFD